MIPITALILTRNEVANILRAVEALPDVEEILVIDSVSTDGTARLVSGRSSKVRVITRAFDDHVSQWNFGLDQVKTEWVLTLDADYELSSELREEIPALTPANEISGYATDFIYRIYGHSLRASSYPSRVVLFRTARGRYVDDGHTQLLKLDGRTEKLKGKTFHDDRKPLSHWILAQDRYAKLESKHLLSLPLRDLSFQDKLRRRAFFAAPAMFLYLLFGRGLILDGWPGWFYVAQRCVAEFLLSMRLLVEMHRLEDEDLGRS